MAKRQTKGSERKQTRPARRAQGSRDQGTGKLRTRIDLDAVIFDGDRDLRASLLADESLRKAIQKAQPAAEVGAARRDLLLSSLKLTPRIAPNMFKAIDKVATTLGLETAIEPYCVASSVMNAFVTPPEDDRVLIGVSSLLLEKMDDAELTFVIGHELGHAAFDHFSMAPSVLLDQKPTPVQAARLFAWMRYAELSADRIGLLACGDVDASIRAFFKLTSGLCEPRFLENAKEAAAQLQELPTSAMESTDEDWFCTHPYGPLRIKAIDLFARSETYFSVIGQVGGELPEAELEAEVARIMRLMDPSFVNGDAPHAAETGEFLVLAGMSVALADGSLDRSEEEVLARVMGEGAIVVDEAALTAVIETGYSERLTELGRHLEMRLPMPRRRKIVEDLAAIALADEQLAGAEIDALVRSAKLLGIEATFVDQSLARARQALD